MNLIRTCILAFIFSASVLFGGVSRTVETFDAVNGFDKIGTNFSLSVIAGVDKKNALALHYRFSEKEKFLGIGKKINVDLPDNYSFTFFAKGKGTRCGLEFKLMDSAGNVYLKKWQKMLVSDVWEKFEVKKSEIFYGWGPDTKASLKTVAKIELVLTSVEEGEGEISLDNLQLNELPLPKESEKLPVTVTASSIEKEETGAVNAVDGNMNTRWASKFDDNQWLSLDFGKPIKLVGLVLTWEAAYAKSYDILVSNDNQKWEKVFSTEQGFGGVEDIDLKKVECRYITFKFKRRATGWGFSIYEIVPKTEQFPFGIGRVDPETILKKKWDFAGNEKKVLYIPQSWKGQSASVWINSGDVDCSFILNGKTIKTVTKEMKKPVFVSIKNDILPGKENTVEIKTAEEQKDPVRIPAVLFGSTEQAFFQEAGRLRNLSPIDYYKFLGLLYREGYFLAWIYEKQSFWTIVGMDRGFEESLFSQTGIIDSYKKGFSIIPLLLSHNRLSSGCDFPVTRDMKDGYLPIPSVEWTVDNVNFHQKLFAYNPNGKAATYVVYTFKNNGKTDYSGKLFLIIRAMEINPPWQVGGLTTIDSISKSGNKVVINHTRGIIFSETPDGFGALPYSKGDIIESVRMDSLSSVQSITDEKGLASAAVSFSLKIPAGGEKKISFMLPLDNDISGYPAISPEDISKVDPIAEQYWKSKLDKLSINIPDKKIVDVMRASVGYMMINMDGPAIQPGSRCYKESWIRDGSVMASAFCRTGHPEETRDFLLWYSASIPESGDTPCIVDAKTGKIPDFAKTWPEYDSPGAYLFTAGDYYSFTHDKVTLEKIFPSLEQTFKYLKRLRAQMLDAQYLNKPGYGMLPKSFSHEGYIDNAQQSLWDDFYALSGLKEFQKMALVLGKKSLADEAALEEKELRKWVQSGITGAMKEKKLDCIPSSIGLGDIDPTGTAVAAFPTLEYKYLDRKLFLATMDRHYNGTFIGRIKNGLTSSYTPYEIRIAEAYLMLGEKEKMATMVHQYMKDIRPLEWNHWAEVVHPNPLSPVYIGDMPHCWISAIFAALARDMFLYEDDGVLVLGAGVQEEWLAIQPISVSNMPSYYGNISYSMKKNGNQVTVALASPNFQQPEKYIALRFPLAGKVKSIIADGAAVKSTDIFRNEVHFKYFPANVVITY